MTTAKYLSQIKEFDIKIDRKIAEKKGYVKLRHLQVETVMASECKLLLSVTSWEIQL